MFKIRGGKVMKIFIEKINDVVKSAFEELGYDKETGKVNVSNRPDLCQYQCNGALANAKKHKKAPMVIAQEVVEKLKDNGMFAKLEAVAPGFINMNINDEFLVNYVNEMNKDEQFGVSKTTEIKKIVVDYGGANVAKPLHIGHLRSAIIGESIKRIAKFLGHDVIGDVHLGDWGLQMGMVISEVERRNPSLPYFDENFTGEYPEEAPFTIDELEDIYPYASKLAKSDEKVMEAAKQATVELQQGRRGYVALWKHILNVSVADLKNRIKLAEYIEKKHGEKINKDLEYSLINIPFDENSEKLKYLWQDLVDMTADGEPVSRMWYYVDTESEDIEAMKLDDLEQLYKKMDLLNSYCNALNISEYDERIRMLKEEISERIVRELTNGEFFNKCKRCGKRLEWNHRFGMCEKCYEINKLERMRYKADKWR